MNKITACIITKNEEDSIRDCIKSIYNVVDEIIVVDSNSTDKTLEILKEFGTKIKIFNYKVDSTHFRKDARNFCLRKARNNWILVLDSDEILDKDFPHKIRKISNLNDRDGYFMPWYTYSDGKLLTKDYKLAFFKNSRKIFYKSSIHENPTISVRLMKGNCGWLDSIIRHYPGRTKLIQERKKYLKRLILETKKHPRNIRAFWFLGYHYFREEDEKSIKALMKAVNSKSKLYPVEILNSNMLLSQIYIEKKQFNKAIKRLYRSLFILKQYKNDFEIKINFHAKNWITDCIEKIEKDNTNKIKKIYLFGY
jgi:glycosyltransferase involved in cell wall biosynthesis